MGMIIWKNYYYKIDSDDKKNFELFCESIGITPSIAINMFIKATLREGKIPFELKSNPFYSKENQDVLKRSINKIENTSGTIHNIDLDI